MKIIVEFDEIEFASFLSWKKRRAQLGELKKQIDENEKRFCDPELSQQSAWPKRIVLALNAYGIKTIGELKNMSDAKLELVPGLGPVGIAYVKQAIGRK